eukprot:CAMPEP_0181370220 /NCGR_PEP_ID=MMETSP1106-20121128/13290_1 /TAXON_ID=81844 /ORGANISM="Mantoniella antarctica, Strain SL-175" /LENGTH=120 /DNA_ID=CAMNT_0023486959 /DNA_START=146 /DNA_END=504 /DNA_ORIENTATION=-
MGMPTSLPPRGSWAHLCCPDPPLPEPETASPKHANRIAAATAVNKKILLPPLPPLLPRLPPPRFLVPPTAWIAPQPSTALSSTRATRAAAGCSSDIAAPIVHSTSDPLMSSTKDISADFR